MPTVIQDSPTSTDLLGPSSPSVPPGPSWVGLGLVLIVSLALLLAQVYGHAPEPLGNVDLAAYLFQAQTFAQGDLWVPEPPLAEFFETIMVIRREGRMFSKYPPGTALFLAAGIRLFHSPRLIPPLLCVGTLLVLFLLAREMYDHRTALLAALLVGVSPFLFQYGNALMSDAPSLFLTALTWLFFVRGGQRGQRREMLWSGLGLGALVLTRPFTAGIVGVVLGVAGRVFVVRYGSTVPYHATTGADHKPRPSPLVPRPSSLWLLPGLFLGVILLFLYHYLLTGLITPSLHHLYAPTDQIGFGWRGVQDVLPQHDYTPLLALSHLGRRLCDLNGWLFGSYLSLAFAGVALFRRRAALRPWAELCLLFGVALVAGYAFYFHSHPRYYLELLLPLGVMSARGLLYLWMGREALTPQSPLPTVGEREERAVLHTNNHSLPTERYGSRLTAHGSRLRNSLPTGKLAALILMAFIFVPTLTLTLPTHVAGRPLLPVSVSLLLAKALPRHTLGRAILSDPLQTQLRAAAAEGPVLVFLTPRKFRVSPSQFSQRRLGWPDRGLLNAPTFDNNPLYVLDLDGRHEELLRHYPHHRVLRLVYDGPRRVRLEEVAGKGRPH